jgi:hypothetical protein
MNNAKFEDQRCEIAEKMFDILNKNPNILIYEAKFRTAVINKISEVEQHISKRSDKFQIEKQQEFIRMMAISTRINVRNSPMRQKIYKYLGKIDKVFKDYKDWSYGIGLKVQIDNLNKTLELIKNNPYYVSTPVLN